ncbi:branched-chain amino acid transport system permease protein [Saccharopolyspora antimicrobica]|uniref:Amino acid/amide ABC transporter membrane protein 2 (HAAT family) n=1 Tax=Saccharopolyspora antimicrobica TaxID=455193 RepID=A0A1I4RD66_9PSEU|nr:branched-chain amino acid ABC transporter permease [Saccharopolyspora antimicrobica]RKT88059.1 amino acid/amide ABC transporter membrane protein 2 (HAAT family) [Saccharopolyspora antimicrobica]SFM50145.1 branched-chain amino acid transport system permease protein [Saccharopolyspora antimicrobica]
MRSVSDLLRYAGLLALAALVLAFPQLAPDAFILSVGVVIMSYAVLATSWNFVGGFTGYISLGHAAYSGLGGYATALLITRTGMNPWLALVAGAVLVALLAIPIGIASLRVRGASFVIVSIALVLITLLVFQSWGALTGGSNGLRVPRPFGEGVLRPEQHERFFYLHAALLALALLCWWIIDRSRFGAGLKAIREDEDKAQSLGVPTFAYKLVVFVISALFTALGGGLYALWFGFLDPVFQFSILAGSYLVLMSLLGGIRSLFGPLLGAVVVGYAVEFFKNQYGDTQLHLVALGVLLAVVVLFMPEGVIPALSGQLRKLRPRATSIREVSQAELAAQRTPEEATR